MKRMKSGPLYSIVAIPAAIFFLGAALQLRAQIPSEEKVIAASKKVIADLKPSDSAPGCAVGVSLEGKPVFRHGFGLAELEHKVPITADTIFESGSVAKQFTAAALVILEIDGKLSIDDPVRKYIPELPDYGAPLTIRHILNHTAGLRDWGAVMGLTGVGRGERIVRQNYAIHVITNQKALDFTPGAEYSYSNSGYQLATEIVERVSGKSLPEFTKERIFDPIGMKDTSWRDDYTRLVPGRAQAYGGPREGPWGLEMPFMNVYGNGGILTTIGDFLKWNAALDSGRWQTMVDMLETQGVLNNGRKISYALGLGVDNYNGIREVSHGGRTAGYVTFLARYPELGVSTAVFCNAPSNNPAGIARRIVDEITGPRKEEGGPQTVSITADELKKYEALWKSELTHMPLTTRVDPKTGDLRVNNAPLRPLKDGSFQVGNGDGRMRFGFDRGGNPLLLEVTEESGTFRFTAEEAWKPAEADLSGLAGTWYSEEADANVEVLVNEGKVSVRLESLEELPLLPRYKDHFTVGPGGIILWLNRNNAGKLETLHIGSGRMRDMPFSRLPH